jgi:hypothetical protein
MMKQENQNEQYQNRYENLRNKVDQTMVKVNAAKNI